MDNDQLRIAISFFFAGFGTLGFALAWETIRRIKRNDKGNGGDGGNDPYHYDPDDPQDWWKKDKVNK